MKPEQKPEKKLKLYLAVAIATVVCIALVAVLGARNQTANPPSASLSSTAGSSGAHAVETALAQAKAANPDTVAWLTVPSTDIDNAVLQSTDNDYYLFRDERGETTEWGSYFADYYANLTQPSSLVQNTVIYGHTGNRENPDGEKFSQLFRYADLAFLRENPAISLTVGNETLTFAVFAVFYTEIDFYYIDPTPSDQGFDTFLQEVNARNEFIFEGSPVTAQDKLLTLSGCSHKYDVNGTGNHRFVIMAKLVDGDLAGASASIQQNPSPKRPNSA